MIALEMLTMSPHAAMIPWAEVAMQESCLGRTLMVLRSSPPVLGAPKKVATWDSWLSTTL